MKVQTLRRAMAKATLLIAMLLCATTMYAQRQISGTVTDSTGDPLTGASVTVKGTQMGTVTNIDGEFSLNVPQSAKTLVVSYVGFLPQEVAITGNKIDIVMKENEEILNEVVVVGYGTMLRKDVTSSITTVNAKDFNVGSYTDPAQLLQGKVPGLTVVQSSDPNGGTASVTLRGASTLNGSTAPLYVIDGIPGVDLSLVAPEDIESIDVLRDASATAIYGSRAANGVIIVTTKKGKEGKAQVNYSGYVSFENIIKHLDVMTADQMRNYAKQNGLEIDDHGANTNWADEVSRTGFSHNHNLSISGGNTTTNYNASLNYRERDGVIRGSGNNLVTIRSMVSSSILKDHVNLTLGVNGHVGNGWGVPNGTQGTSVFDAMYYYTPLAPVTNVDGSWFDNHTSVSQSYNPLSMINEDTNRTTNKRLQILGKVSVNIIDGLLLNANFNYQNATWAYKGYNSTKSQMVSKNGVSHRNTSQSIMKQMEIYANYDKTFAQVNKLSLMAGYSWEEQNNGDGFGAETYNFYNDDLLWWNIGMGNSKDVANCIWGNGLTQTRLISFYARANYSYDSRYILQAAIRRDGSSAFGANNRWATFPSFSAAWRLSDESFMKNLGVFNDLKIRVGYGESGNPAGFDPYISRFMYTNNGWFTYTDPVTGAQNQYHMLGVARNANPDLKWETTSMLNVGIDFAFFNSRLNGTIEYYNKSTRDMIYDYEVSTAIYPVSWMTANVGKMRNRGVELTINAVPVQTRDFTWTTSLNLTHNKNEVVSISNGTYSKDYIDRYNPDVAGASTNIIRILEGKPIGTFYMWEWAGYDENGISQFYKLNENGEKFTDPETGKLAVTGNPEDSDRSEMGCAQPKLTLGWNNTLNWKNWDLNAFFTGVFGNKIFNELEAYYSNTTLVKTGKNCLANVVTNQKFSDTHAQYPSNRYLSDGSYFRLAALTLGYTVPKNVFNGWLNGLHLYATCNNVFTITNYSGRDPEINLGGLEPGIDARKTQYPRTRSFIFGATINF